VRAEVGVRGADVAEDNVGAACQSTRRGSISSLQALTQRQTGRSTYLQTGRPSRRRSTCWLLGGRLSPAIAARSFVRPADARRERELVVASDLLLLSSPS
jgi:hypothetical protein